MMQFKHWKLWFKGSKLFCNVLAGVGIVTDQSSSGIVENTDSPRSVVHRNWAVHRHHLNLISLAFSFDQGLNFLRILSHHSSPCARLPLGCASIDHTSHGKDCQAQNGFAVHNFSCMCSI